MTEQELPPTQYAPHNIPAPDGYEWKHFICCAGMDDNCNNGTGCTTTNGEGYGCDILYKADHSRITASMMTPDELRAADQPDTAAQWLADFAELGTFNYGAGLASRAEPIIRDLVAWKVILQQQVDALKAECNARGNILSHNVEQWRSMFPDEIGNSWYYPGDKVKRLIDRLEHERDILSRNASDRFINSLVEMLFIVLKAFDSGNPASPKDYTRTYLDMLDYRGWAETRGVGDDIVFVPTEAGRRYAEYLGYKPQQERAT